MGSLCIIPARGGSKRIPRKNIKDFLGKPIIAYSIETALKSELFDEVMVSTDDEEIAKIAVEYGAKVPFMRTKENSNDFATTLDVIEEVLKSYQKIDKSFNEICCMYPCAPFSTKELLKESKDLLLKYGYDSVFPVVPFSYPIQRALILGDNAEAQMITPENANSRTQDLENTYHDSGQFYWIHPNQVLNKKKIITDNVGVVEVSELSCHDIDTLSDWKLAELKFTLLKSNRV